MSDTIRKDIETHIEMLVDDEMRAHAFASKEHDTAFQVFRLFGGYRQALNEINTLRTQLAEATARAEKAEKHCREHHLEPCETCMANESDLIAVTAARDRMKNAFGDLLKSHGWYTQREYESDSSYNDTSRGYREEEAAIEVYRDVFGEQALTAALTAPEKREDEEEFIYDIHERLPKREVCRWKENYTTTGGISYSTECGAWYSIGYGTRLKNCDNCGLPIVEEKE